MLHVVVRAEKVNETVVQLRRYATAALVSDALDSLGLLRQAVGFDIVPFSGDGVMVGRAFTVALEAPATVPVDRYARLLRTLDEIGPGEVYVAATGRADHVAVWGELLSTACRSKGVVGIVTDGLVRDIAKVRVLRYPVFARGTLPYDFHPRLEIADSGTPVTIDGVEIRRGDIVVADADGVVVVPSALIDEVAEFVVTKATGESKFRQAVSEGMAPSEAYARYKVL